MQSYLIFSRVCIRVKKGHTYTQFFPIGRNDGGMVYVGKGRQGWCPRGGKLIKIRKNIPHISCEVEGGIPEYFSKHVALSGRVVAAENRPGKNQTKFGNTYI